MKKSSLPYKQVIFVCTNARGVGERISCAGEGRCGEAILQKLKTYIKTHHLEGVVRAAKSGCQEKCETGPSIMAMPQNEHLSDVKLADVDTIIKTYLDPLI
jgi:(2Fe-2S) ferredoxin